jgi:hypothetical protein
MLGIFGLKTERGSKDHETGENCTKRSFIIVTLHQILEQSNQGG